MTTYLDKAKAEDDAYATWLLGLKAGDKVAWRVYSSFAREADYKILTIDRLTNTQFITGGDRFYRRTGRRITGGTFDKIVPISEDVLRTAELNLLRNWLAKLVLHSRGVKDIPLAALKAMKEAYDKAMQEDTPAE